MTRLPSLNGERIVTALGKAGFQVLRQKGSHIYLKHPDGRATVVPVHRGESVGRGLLRKNDKGCRFRERGISEVTLMDRTATEPS